MFKHILLILAIVTATLPTAITAQANQKDNLTYLRIFYHKGMRCGYVETPFSWHDKENNLITGLAQTIMEAFSHKMDVKIRWEEEVTFGNMFAGLTENRYDAICTPTIFKVDGARQGTYTAPLFFTGIFAYQLKDQATAAISNQSLNTSDTVIAIYKGSNEEKLAKKVFPKAKKLTVPAEAPLDNLIQNLTNGTAHYVILPPTRAVKHNENSDTKIARINDEPLRRFPYRLAFPADEFRLKHIFDLTIEEMINNGEMDTILDLYDETGELYIRRKSPFR